MASVSDDILKSIGWPEDILVLDFETYFDKDYTLERLSTTEFIMDGRFDFTGLGIQKDDYDPIFVGKDAINGTIKRLQTRFGLNFEECTVVALNCKFDVTVLLDKFSIDPPYVIDILDLARYYDSRMKHSLKDLARLFKLPPKGETAQFKGLHWEDMNGEQHCALKEYCKRDIEDEASLLNILLPMLDNPEYELSLAKHTLNLFLHPMLRLDMDMACEIREGMNAALAEDLDKVSWVLENYSTKTKDTVEKIMRARSIFPKILADTLPDGEQVPMKQGKKEMIPALAQEDISFQLLLAHSNDRVKNLCKTKAACTSWPLHRKKIESIIKDTKLTNGLIRVPLKYYGAHTGRWSGGGDNSGKNLLNLGGKGRGKAIHPLIAKVRNTLVAPPGHTLIIQDSAQIEARELAWFTGQADLVKAFANNADPYSQLATKIFKEEVRKPKETDDPETSALLTIRRGFGKDAILGCIARGSIVPVRRPNGMIKNKLIERVCLEDRLWDGSNWIEHKGVISKGKKSCISVNNLWLTPDHEILLSDGWTTAAELSINNQKWVIDSENSKLNGLSRDLVGVLSPSNVIAPVVERLLRQETILYQESLHAVMSVLKRHPVKLRAIAHSLRNHTNQGFLIEFVRSLADVKPNHINTMVKEVSEYGPLGSQIEFHFLSTWQNWKDSIILTLKSIGSIMTGDMNLVISDSLPGSRILETVDILYSGTYKRFQCNGFLVSNCGYGMGTNTFFDRCRQNETLRPLFDSGEYDWDFINGLIKTYRTTYAQVPIFWNEIEKMFRIVTKYPNEIRTWYIPDNGLCLHKGFEDQNEIIRNAVFTLWKEGSTTIIQLPSGRRLFYRHAAASVKQGKLKYEHGPLWGGTLTENVDQAICRDLMAGWLLQCEAVDIPIVLHTYDELVGCVPVDRAEEKLQQMHDIMCVTPDWAAGLPLDAEGEISERYKK